VAVRSGAGTEIRVIGSLLRMEVAGENPERLIARMADPATRIVSLTVTEKGYCHAPQTGELDEAHPDIVHDLASPQAPHSAAGFLVEALARRKQAGAPPFTILCCDNLSANGRTVQRIVTRFAALRSKDLAHWIEDRAAFPSTMVDRIVPETTDADRAAVSSALGMTDAWPVVTEPFTQWIVEDRFASGRPDFAAAGVQLVSDVTPFEHMKLRLLNASHSALAYLGYLAGYETIADTMADPHFAAFAARVMQEAAVTLKMPEGTDLAAYQASLLGRFANPALHHRTWQIAMDGSQKLPQRLLAAMADRLQQGLPIDTHALAVAGWMRYVTARDERDKEIDVRDPIAGKLAAIAREAGPVAGRLAPALLAVESVFGTLGTDPRVASAVTDALEQLYRLGARRVLAADHV
jgi:fructuronate reductase